MSPPKSATAAPAARLASVAPAKRKQESTSARASVPSSVYARTFGPVASALAAREPEAATIARTLEAAVAAVVDERVRAMLGTSASAKSDRLEPPRFASDLLGGGLARAIDEGEAFKRRELDHPSMLSGEEAARRVGLTRQALDERRKAGTALALAHVKRGFKYPAWQFSDRLAAPLEALWPVLAAVDAWEKYLFLTEPEPLLGGRAPIDALRAGERDAVLAVANTLLEDGLLITSRRIE